MSKIVRPFSILLPQLNMLCRGFLLCVRVYSCDVCPVPRFPVTWTLLLALPRFAQCFSSFLSEGARVPPGAWWVMFNALPGLLLHLWPW